PVFAEEVNSRGTLNVLEAARGSAVKRVIYASTIWVYNGHSAEEVNEDSELSLPAHLYTATKVAGEMYCTSFAELYDVEYTVVRDLVGDVDIVHVESRVGDFRGAEVSGERAEVELGWTAQTSFVDGVGRYLEWYRAEHEAADPVA